MVAELSNYKNSFFDMKNCNEFTKIGTWGHILKKASCLFFIV